MGRPKITCNVGDRFNLFEVIDNTPIMKGGHTHVKVKCTNCGSEQLKPISDLRRGNCKGCKKCSARRLHKDKEFHIGDTFGKLTIISNRLDSDGSGKSKYICRCVCGNTRIVTRNDLVTGRTTQCYPCSRKQSGKTLMKHNGAAGELGINRFHKLKKSAEVRKHEFNVSMEYLWNLFLQQNKCCAITGDYIGNINNASLDRINSSLGYLEGNVQWVTKQANISKHIMSMDELYEFCHKVLNHANQQPSTPLTKCEGSETNS